jgi:hypothetical protein
LVRHGTTVGRGIRRALSARYTPGAHAGSIVL